jgi:hypothetical protein
MNYQLTLNQFINNESAVSLYYYNGRMPYVDPNDLASNSPNALVKFDRWALYANYQVLPTVNLLGGYAWGKDSVDQAAVTALGLGTDVYDPAKLGKSKGYFLEANYFPIEKLGLGARYDSFDPSDTVGHNTVKAYTLSGNLSIFEGLQLIADYQHKTTEAGATAGSNKDDTLQVRGIIIF